MISLAIDKSKHETLKAELKAQYPSLTEKDLNAESLQNLISEVSLITHQDENTISRIIEEKLEYINSKSI